MEGGMWGEGGRKYITGTESADLGVDKVQSL